MDLDDGPEDRSHANDICHGSWWNETACQFCKGPYLRHHEGSTFLKRREVLCIINDFYAYMGLCMFSFRTAGSASYLTPVQENWPASDKGTVVAWVCPSCIDDTVDFVCRAKELDRQMNHIYCDACGTLMLDTPWFQFRGLMTMCRNCVHEKTFLSLFALKRNISTNRIPKRIRNASSMSVTDAFIQCLPNYQDDAVWVINQLYATRSEHSELTHQWQHVKKLRTGRMVMECLSKFMPGLSEEEKLHFTRSYGGKFHDTSFPTTPAHFLSWLMGNDEELDDTNEDPVNTRFKDERDFDPIEPLYLTDESSDYDFTDEEEDSDNEAEQTLIEEPRNENPTNFIS